MLLLGSACKSPDATVDAGARDDLAVAAPPDLAGIDWTWVAPDLTFTNWDAGAPPATRCDGDASVPDGGIVCAPPRSECVDPSTFLVYYTNGRCVNGTCQWDRRFLDCDQSNMRCYAGAGANGAGCQYQLTMS